MKWEKKFNLTRDGEAVLANYNNERTYRLKFNGEKEAEFFLRDFQEAQAEIEIHGKLKTRIKIACNVQNRIIKFIFADHNSMLAVNSEFDSTDEMLTFYSKMRNQITKYSDWTLQTLAQSHFANYS